MKLWLDANLDPALCAWLGSRFGVDARHVRELDLARKTDVELFEAAARLNVTVLMTKDSDLVDLVIERGPPPKIIWLTSGNLATIALQQILSQHFAEAVRLLDGGQDWVEIGS
jgi:predicted nuclease of predicted toxin-antitoxin system